MVEISAKDQSGQGCVVSQIYLLLQTSGLFLSAFVFFLFIPNFISALAISLRSHQFKDELMVMTLLNMKF